MIATTEEEPQQPQRDRPPPTTILTIVDDILGLPVVEWNLPEAFVAALIQWWARLHGTIVHPLEAIIHSVGEEGGLDAQTRRITAIILVVLVEQGLAIRNVMID